MHNTLPIETARLILVPLKAEHVTAFGAGRQALSALLGVEVPPEWPVSPESLTCWQGRPEKLGQAGGWAAYLFIHRQDGILVGDGGFKGRPDSAGEVEIGYALVPAYRGRGLATEAARALADLAFEQPEVTGLCAETLTDGYASMRVVQKLGLTFDKLVHSQAEGDVFRWRASQAEYFAFHHPDPLRPDTSACGSASMQTEPFLGYTFDNSELDKENRDDRRPGGPQQPVV